MDAMMQVRLDSVVVRLPKTRYGVDKTYETIG